MSLRYPYDSSSEPPAPVVPVRIAAPGRPEHGIAVPALVDSGADLTVVPVSVAAVADLTPIGRVNVEGVAGTVARAAVYAAEIEINGVREIAEVIALGGQTLLGRNLLNRWVLVLDGPRLRLEMTG